MNIKKTIQKLIDLQKVDLEIRDLTIQRNAEKPEIIRQLEEDFAVQKTTLEQRDAEYKDIQKQKKEKELDLADTEEKVRKAQAALYQLKTNQEYQAKLKEINSFKADVSVIEEDMLNILDTIDQKKTELGQEKNKIQDKEKEFKQKKSEVEEEMRELDAGIANLQDKRNVLTKDIDPDSLHRYELLLAKKSGLAIVPLRQGSCGGCYLKLPPEVTNKVKKYADLVQCEMCTRILYVDEDFIE